MFRFGELLPLNPIMLALIDKFSNIRHGKINGTWVVWFRDLDLSLVIPGSRILLQPFINWPCLQSSQVKFSPPCKLPADHPTPDWDTICIFLN